MNIVISSRSNIAEFQNGENYGAWFCNIAPHRKKVEIVYTLMELSSVRLFGNNLQTFLNTWNYVLDCFQENSMESIKHYYFSEAMRIALISKQISRIFAERRSKATIAFIPCSASMRHVTCLSSIQGRTRCVMRYPEHYAQASTHTRTPTKGSKA